MCCNTTGNHAFSGNSSHIERNHLIAYALVKKEEIEEALGIRAVNYL